MSSIHPTAEIAPSVRLASEVSVWQFAHIREDCVLGSRTIIGRGVYLGPGVRVGSNVKIQNYSLIYESAEIENGVFIGPNVIFTNDRNPRAVNMYGELKSGNEWQKVGVKVEEGASIGAGSVCVAPIKIGKWSMVAAGSTVVKDVPSFALVAGNPAVFLGWVGQAGFRLRQESSTRFICPKTRQRYLLLPNRGLAPEESF